MLRDFSLLQPGGSDEGPPVSSVLLRSRHITRPMPRSLPERPPARAATSPSVPQPVRRPRFAAAPPNPASLPRRPVPGGRGTAGRPFDNSRHNPKERRRIPPSGDGVSPLRRNVLRKAKAPPALQKEKTGPSRGAFGPSCGERSGQAQKVPKEMGPETPCRRRPLPGGPDGLIAD